MKLKSLNLLNAHLVLLLNPRTKFQLLNSIWREKREGTALFQGQKGGKPSYFTFQLTQEVDFWMCHITLDLLWIGSNGNYFYVFDL